MAHSRKFVIIGIVQFGRALALHLHEEGYEVTAIDERESVISDIKDKVTQPIIGDATRDSLLDKLDLGNNTHVIVAVGEKFERNLLIAAHLKISKKVENLYVRSVNELQAEMLKLLGINELFRVEDVAARQLARRFVNRSFKSLTTIDSTHSLAEVPLPDEWVGKSLMESGLRSKYRLNLITVRRGQLSETSPGEAIIEEPEQPVIGTPDPTMTFQTGDVLVLFGKQSDLDDFVDDFGKDISANA